MTSMDIIKFTKIVGKLKRLKRTGWVKYNIINPESVAEHSFRLVILAMILAPKIGVNQLKSIKMALIHDIGEAEIGDIITFHGKMRMSDPLTKAKKERKAIKRIFSLIDTKEYIKIFDEFESNKTREAQFIRQLDKLEMGIQAMEYEKQQKIDLETFFVNTRTHVLDNYLKEILQKIEFLRPKK